ncbi:MAG: aldo/keto reductase [Spirochaetaceae bacterium]|jgi:aryl-alcohol dehydrogenase-like predicted oxidoreductase|nr:aldo/keto reductase [Spirochaetaceae bacterium]
MIYRQFGNTGISASAVGLGTWNIGNQWGEISENTAFAVIQTSLEAGINLFDTAEVYGIPHGLSEERLGKALSGKRHRVSIVSKTGHWGNSTNQKVPMTTKDMFVLCCHGSLYRLRTDYIDVYLCHINELPEEETDRYLEGFEELKHRGLIRFYGISTDNLEVLKRFNKHGTCQAVELEYSLVNRNAENGLLDYAKENGMGVLIRGPLAKGVLSGRYNRDSTFDDTVRKAWNQGGSGRENFNWRMDRLEKILTKVPREGLSETAIRFTASHPAAPVSIPGAKSPEQALANARAGDRLFNPSELAAFEGL